MESRLSLLQGTRHSSTTPTATPTATTYSSTTQRKEQNPFQHFAYSPSKFQQINYPRPSPVAIDSPKLDTPNQEATEAVILLKNPFDQQGLDPYEIYQQQRARAVVKSSLVTGPVAKKRKRKISLTPSIQDIQ